MYIGAQNHGKIPVYLEKPFLKIVNNKHTEDVDINLTRVDFSENVYLAEVSFPYKLEPRENCKAFIRTDAILKTMNKYSFDEKVKLTAVYRSQLGQEFKSDQSFTLSEIKEWNERINEDEITNLDGGTVN